MSRSLALHPVEPPAGPWSAVRFEDVAERLLASGGRPAGRPRVLAVDGRGASGKTTVAGRFLTLPDRRVAVIHTDDIAWNQAIMDWARLLVDGVLRPVHEGRLPVRYRPPAWDAHGRAGAIEVPARTDVVVVEGVGAARRDLAEWYDATVWVQSDVAVAKARGIARDGGDQHATDFWDVWEAEEEPFLAADRPWERADLVVCGTPGLGHDPTTEVVVAGRGAGRGAVEDRSA